MNKINSIPSFQVHTTFDKNKNVENPIVTTYTGLASDNQYMKSETSFASMAYGLSHINKKKWDQEYLNGIQNESFKKIDGAGNNDNKVTVDEVLNDLNIPDLLLEQNEVDTAKIKAVADKIPEALVQYAGQDGEFTPEEYAEFLNGSEWGAVLEAWHSSGQDAKLEMNWIGNTNLPDIAVSKGDIKAGILNNFEVLGVNFDTTEIESVIDKYAGEDGMFTQKEYMALRKDPLYKDILKKYNVTPWFKFGE